MCSADVDHQTDDEVLNLYYSVPKKDWTTSGCPPRLTPDVVAKWVPRLLTGWPSEALAQDLIRNHTNIPVPPIWRVLNLNPDASIIVMDYIPGITLVEAWPTMGLWQKIRTAITLRSYVRQLRSIAHPRSQIPGPVLEGEEPGVCYVSRIFGPVRPTKGPFATSQELIRLFNNGMDQAALAQLCVHKEPLLDDGTLVYSHVDFAM
ncbi:hypothetical protein ARMGADRAFT_1074894 [Armillaria gallica]|uniref:Aminoglycoside phosphotransferase domain-containing protein n=1 Tax=Armillaria gallica TaxID=47427 RepID=A0A2H3EEZ1_ARMGA|nr:hypothetical protein ARMGADRAFT_1074894 [Armillaria gallica]